MAALECSSATLFAENPYSQNPFSFQDTAVLKEPQKYYESPASYLLGRDRVLGPLPGADSLL